MAKKGKGKNGQLGKIPANGPEKNDVLINQDVLKMMSDIASSKLTEEDREVYEAMCNLASLGVTPEDYSLFYNVFRLIEPDADIEENDWEESRYVNPFSNMELGRRGKPVEVYTPLKDAASHTLVLKIQMKDVSKPPMWREVEVPANYNFMQLHEIIQAVSGLDDCHLWQFNKKAYDDSLLIGFEDDCGGVADVTHDAEETMLTQFLQKKGDKLEYVYDFGDDWIFIVEVKDLLDKKSDYPICRKFKSEMNAMEDVGGIWSYLAMREDLAEWGKLSKKQQKQHASQCGFDSEEDYILFLNESRISLDDVNDVLRFI